MPMAECFYEAKKHIRRDKYRGSAFQSAGVVATTLALFFLAAWLGWVAGDGQSGLVVRLVSWALWTGAALRSFMIFHDAGHGSFVQYPTPYAKFLNAAATHIFAALCVTPTDWNLGHQLHHKHSGNMDQDMYSWNETVFHSVTEYKEMSRRNRCLYRLLRHPAFFFPMAPLFIWYVRMRLPFELPGFRNKASSYRTSVKMYNTLLMIIRYMLAYRLGILGIVWAGDYAAGTIGVVLFHVQHAYETSHVVQSSKDWDMLDAALKGSSFLQVHPLLKFFTLGIEYHHIHHMNIRIPGYMLKACHDEAPDGLWDAFEVHKLHPLEMWASLFLTLWDTDAKKFVPFPESFIFESERIPPH